MSAGAVFRTEIPVRFADVDDARVVYYPQYLDYCHVAFEDFMQAGLGRPYADVFQGEGVGFPAVNVQVDYSAPARFGDVLRVRIDCVALGTSSVTLRYRMGRARDGVACCEARVTAACIAMDGFRPMPIPEGIRRHFAAHLVRDEVREGD